MKVHLINTYLLVPQSSSSAKVKYEGQIFQKMSVVGGISVSQMQQAISPVPTIFSKAFSLGSLTE